MKRLLFLSCLLAPLFALPAYSQDKAPRVPDPPAIEKGRGYVPLTPERRAHFQRQSHAQHAGRIRMMAKNNVLPPSFDAADKVPLPVWDQGQCGSCYEVSTVRTATCALLQRGWGKPDDSFKLSLQFGMDRPRNFGGCNGGNGTEVIDWMIKNGWPAEKYVDLDGTAHNDYPPYEARSGSDRTKPGAKLWMKDATWGFVNSNGNPTIDEIKAALFNFGRLNCSLDAGGQFGNGTTTITSLGTQIDHEINIRAYDDNHDNGNGTKGAVLLENQWNTQWGVQGCRWCSYKASRNIVDIFFVSATPLPPIPPSPGPTPGNLVPPFYITAPAPAGPFADLPAATAVAQTKANDCKCVVTVIDAKGTLAATVTPGGPPVPPSPSTDLVVTKIGTYRLLLPKTIDAVAAKGMTIDEYVAAAERVFATMSDAFRPTASEPPLADPLDGVNKRPQR